MKKRIVSAILAVCMLLSCIVAADYAVSATTTDAAKATEYKLANSVDEGVILQAWNWSYANIEKNLEYLASLGYTTLQISPPNTIKEGTSGVKVYLGDGATTGWWMYYQPAGFQLNEKKDNALGTKEELISLTTKAHALGMKIIADGVINHLGTNGDESAAMLSNKNTIEHVTPEAQIYAPEILKANAFHPFFQTMYLERDDQITTYKNNMKSWNVFPNYNYNQTNEYHSTFDQTQGSISNLPDLDTSTEVVQQAILNYFKECIDAGIDGFRFDAAKHIETPDDPSGIASDFWPTVIFGANEYAKEKYNKEMFYYGEILNSCGIGRPYSRYLKYIEITDSSTYYGQFNAVSGNASSYGSSYSNGMDASNAITWSESHDIYMDAVKWNELQSTNTINKRWALAAARDNTAMYFARPADPYTTVLGDLDVTAWASTEVAAVNHFHTEMSGESEYISTSGNFAINERGTTGVVIVNCGGNAAKINNVTMNRLEDGKYIDRVTGNTFKCDNGKLSGTMGDTGIVVLYKEGQTRVSTSVGSGTYYTDTLDVTLSAKNVEKQQYSINGSDPVDYTPGETITVGKADDIAGSTYELTVYGYKNDRLVAVQCNTYTKQAPRTVTVKLGSANWTNVNLYAWNDLTGEKNGEWPGVPMTKNSDGSYSADVLGNYDHVIFNNSSAQTLDLSYTGPGVYTLTSANAEGKYNATVVNSEAEIADPFYVGGYEPTIPPATVNPNGYNAGDTNLDGTVNISDVTTVQKYLVLLIQFNDDQVALADFNNSGSVNIKDATAIQYSLVQ